MKYGARARYTLEIKQDAVRLVRGCEKLSAVAWTPGVSAQSLDNWVKAEAAGRLSRELVAYSAAPPEDLAIRASSRARVQRLFGLN